MELAGRFLSARGVSDFNRARIDLQRFGTPSEVRSVYALSDRMPQAVAQWVARLNDYCFWEKPEPADYRRVTNEPEWTLYEGLGDPGDRELVIGFAGATANFFQPSPVVLQHLDEERHDLLLLRDMRQMGYREGIAGLESFTAVLEAARAIASRYQSLVVLGGSMGGAPAIFAGIRLGARRTVSLGGSLKDLPTASRYLGNAPMLASTGHEVSELIALFAGGVDRDRDGAQSMREQVERLTGRPVTIAGIAGISSHSVPHACFLQGSLASLYRFLLTHDERLPTLPDAPSGESVLQLEATCQPPRWAAPETGPSVWLSNTVPLPEFIRLGIKRIRLPGRLATAIEGAAYRHLGIAVHFRRITSRAPSNRRSAPR